MTFNEIENRIIAIVIWNADKENDVHVYIAGLVKTENGFIFKNESKGWTMPIDNNIIERISVVPDNLKEILLNADYYVNLTLGNISDNLGNYVPTGMIWH